jgi:hypothetical protein
MNYGNVKNAYKILVRIQRLRSKDNIILDIKEIWCEIED